MSQPIYVITEESLTVALDLARKDFPQQGETPGPEWGYFNFAEVKGRLRASKEHVLGMYDFASMASKVKQMETDKMIGTANRGLIRLLHYMKLNRQELKV